MLRKLILLAITSSIGKRLWNAYKAQQARPTPAVSAAVKPATVPVPTASDR